MARHIAAWSRAIRSNPEIRHCVPSARPVFLAPVAARDGDGKDAPSSLKRARYEQWRQLPIAIFQLFATGIGHWQHFHNGNISPAAPPTAATKNRQPPQRKTANRHNEKPPTATTKNRQPPQRAENVLYYSAWKKRNTDRDWQTPF